MNYTKELLEPIVIESRSFSDVLRKLGKSSIHGGAVAYLKKRIIEFKIDFSHFSNSTKGFKLPYKQRSKKYTIEEFKEKFLIKGSNIISDRLKRYLIDNQLLEKKCNKCGNEGKWEGYDLTLQIDHINGDREDNRLENLRILCPNCHSQTNTYSGKKRRIAGDGNGLVC